MTLKRTKYLKELFLFKIEVDWYWILQLFAYWILVSILALFRNFG